jgi:hypothetical protein
MEPLITTPSTESTAPAAMRPMHSHKKRWVLIGSIVLVVSALAIGAWFVFRKHTKTPPTPAESLQQLKDSSHDVYVRPEDRAAKLKTLSGDKTIPKSSTQAQLDILNSLKN